MNLLFPRADGVGGEGTVEAGGRTERNAHIQAVAFLIINGRKQLAFSLGNFDA